MTQYISNRLWAIGYTICAIVKLHDMGYGHPTIIRDRNGRCVLHPGKNAASSESKTVEASSNSFKSSKKSSTGPR